MSPSPCLPTGQAETLPPMPELKKLSSLRRRRKLPSQGPNQAGKERCVPCVDIQSSASGQMATYLSTDAHETTPTLTVHHRNRTEQAMHTKASYMQQRIPPVRSQDSLNFTGYFSPSGYTTDHLSSQHTFPSTQQGNQPTHTVPHGNHTEQAMHTKASNMQQRIPPARSQDSLDFTGCFSSSDHLSSQHTFPSTQQEKQQRFDPSRNVSSQHNEWRRQMQLQQSQVPHPRHRNAQHSYGQDYRSSLHAHYPNYSQYFGNAGYQAHVEGRKESHQPRLPHQMDPFSRQGMQCLPQDPMQMYRQNGLGLQYQYQDQVNREENQRQYQSQMQIYKQQNQDHNQITRMHQYHMQMHQQNGQKQYRLDLHYNARHQVQMGEKHRKSHTEEYPVNMKACREQNQYQNYIKHCQTQFSQSKTQQVHRAEEDKELPQQTNQLLHNQQGVGGSLEQCWQAIHRQLHFQNLTLERGKANESSPKDNANVAGSPKSDVTPPEENTHSPPNLLNGNPQSQMDSPSGETDENHTQHHPQTSHDIVSSPSSVSEDLEQTTMVGGHTLISAETFLSYLKTSAAEEDNGGKTHTPVSAPHSSYRVNTKTGASIRFIDLLDDESEDGEDATVSPRRSSTSTDHEKEMNYFDNSENNAHLGCSSPVYKQVDRNSDSENSFTDNMQREMVREIYTEVTELDGSFQPTNVLKPSEGIPTLVGCDTPHYSDPTRLEYREIETGRCKHPENNVSSVYKQGEDNAVDIQTDNTQKEIIEETHTPSNFLRESAPTVIDCVTPPASNPTTPENHEEMGKYDESENDTILDSSSVHKQADRDVHINHNLNYDSQREMDEGNQPSNTSSENVEIGIPQCVSFPSVETPPQPGSFQPAIMLDACINDRLTPPDSDPPTPEKHGKDTNKCRNTEDALSRSFSAVHKRSGENTHFKNNISENTQTELSKKVPTPPGFVSDYLKLSLTRGVSPQSVDATPQSGNIRTENKSKPRKAPIFIVRAARYKRDPKTSGYKSKAKKHRRTPKIIAKISTHIGDCTSSVGALTPSTPEVNKLVNFFTSSPEANNVNVSTPQTVASTPPMIAVQMINVPQYTLVLPPLTNTVTSAYTFPSPCISTLPLLDSKTPVHKITSGGPSVHPIELPAQAAAAVTPADSGASTLPLAVPSPLVVANSQTVQEYSPAQPAEVSMPSVDANKPPIHASEPSVQTQETPVGPSNGTVNNPSPSQMVQELPVQAHKLPELVPFRPVRRKKRVSEHPSPKDFASICNLLEKREKTQSNHSEVYAAGVPRMDTGHHEQILQRTDFTARIRIGLDAPDKTKMENGCHKRTFDIDLTKDERPVRCTPDRHATRQEIERSCHKKTLQDNCSATGVQPAPSAPDGFESDPSYHEQIMQRNDLTNALDASDASGTKEINTNYHKKTSQDSSPSNSIQLDLNAKERTNVISHCLMQAFNVSDLATCNPSTPSKHYYETSNFKQQMINGVAIFMKADLFPNAGERPKLETAVQCLTCYETVEGEEACNHMFFGQLKCEKCNKIIPSCQDLQRTLSSVDMCKMNSRRPHRYTDWCVSPIDFLCYRLRKRKSEEDGSGVPSFISTLEAMERYLEILSPLKNMKLWKSALKKCKAFTTMMVASSRQQEDRKKRQRNLNTTEKKKQKTN